MAPQPAAADHALARELARQRELLAGLREVHALSLRSGNELRIFERLLAILITTTGSTHGFIAETRHRAGGSPFLRVRTASNSGWHGAGPAGDELSELDTVWGEAMHTRRPAFSESPAVLPARGHPFADVGPFEACLALPIQYDGVLVGVVAIANDAGYHAHVAAEIEPVLETIAHFIAAFRIEAARLVAEQVRTRALEEAERFRRLFELSNVLPIVASMDGQPREFNSRWTEFLGWSQTELRRRRLESLLHPEDVPLVRREIGRLAAGTESVHFEARYQHKEGGYRWLSWHARAEPEERSIYSVAVDVTLRKQEERRDAELVRTLEMAEEMSHVGWWSMDPRTRSVVWSGEVYRIAGRDPASFKPTMDTALSIYHPDDREGVLEARHLAFKEGRPFRYECRIVRPSGEVRWVASYGRTETDAAGNTTQIFGIFQDVTERHEAADEMEKLAMVASRTSSAVILANGNGRIDWVNDAFTRVFGHAPEGVRGRTPNEILLGPESSTETVAVLTQRMKSGQGWKGELIAYHRSGLPAWVELEVQPLLAPDGQVSRFMGILNDISARKKSEQELVRAREEALEASRVKSQFLANMSHEIRTPMNGVIGSAQLLLGTDLSIEQREYAEAIGNAGRVLLELINDVLDISKIEAGKLELEHEVFSLRQVIEETQASFRPLIARKGLTLGATFSDDVPLRHIGDAVRVRQIVTNLLGNAIKFTQSGGITVAIHRNPDGIIYGTVRDTGVGIPQNRHTALFAPFVQADGSTTRRFGGTGLGLAITRELVRRMGGAIWFDSEVGEGTTFHFTLSLTEAEGLFDESPPELPAPVVAPLPPVRLDILLAEDNPVNALVARRLLEKDGHTVTHAVNGQIAVELALEHEFDVVLMDVQMPVLDGLEATRQLRGTQRPEQRRLPIIALTANAMKGDRDLCIAAGMDAYLSKPLDPAALSRTVLELGRRNNTEFDRAALLTRVGGDLELAFLVAKTCVEAHERLLLQLSQAMAAHDLRAVAKAAHALRGTLSTVAAGAALALTQELEKSALADELEICLGTAPAVDAAVRRLAEELTVWRLSPRPAPEAARAAAGE